MHACDPTLPLVCPRRDRRYIAVKLACRPAQVNVCFLFTFTFTYPLLNFPMRICIHYLFYGETEATNIQHILETVLPL